MIVIFNHAKFMYKMFFITIVLLSLILGGQANRVGILTPQARNRDISAPVCIRKDFDSILPLHHHDHGDICLQTESILAKSMAWTDGPICRSHSNGTTPFCIYSNSSFANGRGISSVKLAWQDNCRKLISLRLITSAEIAEKLTKLPAFTDNQDTSLRGFPPYEVRELPGKGFGVIANKTIERGDRIMAHRVVLAIHNDAVDLSRDEDVEFFNAALKYLPTSTLSKYNNMAAHFGHIDQNVEKMNTNSFSEEFVGKEHWSESIFTNQPISELRDA